MLPQLLQRLCCPDCGGELALEARHREGAHVLEGQLRCCACPARYEIVRGIPRFVSPDNYADSFGAQWQAFRSDQLDSHSGISLSRARFEEVTRWKPEELAGRWTLDAGCGAGRFSEVALEGGARVVAVDMSAAVDACHESLGARFPDQLDVVQADLYRLPFRPRSFERVFTIGVLQHTPDPKRAVRAVCAQVAEGGQLALWMYALNWRTFVGHNAWKYLLRPLTSRLGPRFTRGFAWTLTALLAPVWLPLMHLGAPGRLILGFLPVAARAYAGSGLAARQLLRCVALDTLDWYSPRYDKPQRPQPSCASCWRKASSRSSAPVPPSASTLCESEESTHEHHRVAR